MIASAEGQRTRAILALRRSELVAIERRDVELVDHELKLRCAMPIPTRRGRGR